MRTLLDTEPYGLLLLFLDHVAPFVFSANSTFERNDLIVAPRPQESHIALLSDSYHDSYLVGGWMRP